MGFNLAFKGLTFASGNGASLSIGTLFGNVEGGSFTGDFEGKVNY
jgi:hypothetical protein